MQRKFKLNAKNQFWYEQLLEKRVANVTWTIAEHLYETLTKKVNVDTGRLRQNFNQWQESPQYYYDENDFDQKNFVELLPEGKYEKIYINNFTWYWAYLNYGSGNYMLIFVFGKQYC